MYYFEFNNVRKKAFILVSFNSMKVQVLCFSLDDVEETKELKCAVLAYVVVLYQC